MNSLLMSEWLSSYKISSSNSITSEFQKKSLSCDSYSEWFPMIIKDLIMKKNSFGLHGKINLNGLKLFQINQNKKFDQQIKLFLDLKDERYN